MWVCFWPGIISRLSIRTTLHASLALFGRVFTPCWSMSACKKRLEYVGEQYILSLGRLSFYASSTFWCLLLNWHVLLFNSYLDLTLHNCTWYADVTFLFPEIYKTKNPFLYYLFLVHEQIFIDLPSHVLCQDWILLLYLAQLFVRINADG